MRRVAGKAYWVYIAGASGSILLAFAYYMPHRKDGVELVSPFYGQFSVVDLLLSIMVLTLIYGLFFIMPILLKRENDQKILTSRTAELEVAVVTDPLTGLYNRRYFTDALNEYLAEFNRIKAPLALLTLDLDHFKRVNDTFGHDAGDAVLRQVASKLKGLVREHDIVARTGGEEFCIVAPFSKKEQMRPFAERVCAMVSQMKIEVNGHIVHPTVSIGIASNTNGQTTVEDLIKVSDERLYDAKSQGRNMVCG